MGQPSFQASNAILWVTYGLFLYVSTGNYASSPARSNSSSIFGVVVAWRLRAQATTEFLSSNRTQKGRLRALQCSYVTHTLTALASVKESLWPSISSPVVSLCCHCRSPAAVKPLFPSSQRLAILSSSQGLCPQHTNRQAAHCGR